MATFFRNIIICNCWACPSNAQKLWKINVAGIRKRMSKAAPRRAWKPRSTDRPPTSSSTIAPTRNSGTSGIPWACMYWAVCSQFVILLTPLSRKMADRPMRPNSGAQQMKHCIARLLLHKQG